ncbi:MAG: TIGR04076 family protein [Lachnospiraceae bacterium]
MKHRCKVTILDTKCFTDLQKTYLADPKSGPCPVFHAGDEYIFDRTPDKDDFYHMGLNTLVKSSSDPNETAGGPKVPFCSEAWDAISRYIYTALQGGSIMHGWTNDERVMITCCNDGTRPVIFRLERIDIPENAAEEKWLKEQKFANSADDAYTG